MRAIATVLALLYLGLSAELAGQSILFEDSFEAQLFPWASSTIDEKITHPQGATLVIRGGSMEPGTLVTLAAVEDVVLPPEFTPVGQAWRVTADPPLSYAAELYVPESGARGPVSIIAIAIVGGAFVVVELVGHAWRRIGVLRGGRDSDTVQEITYDNAAQITSFELVPNSSVGSYEDVFADVEWQGIAEEITLDWQDGPEDTQSPNMNDRETTFSHTYATPGLYQVTVQFNYLDLGIHFTKRRDLQVLDPDFRGTWKSTSGDIDFDVKGSGKVIGLYNSSQNGKIDASIIGERTLDGYWIETITNEECETEKDDSEGEPTKNWGSLLFQFNEDFTQFCGQWSYCEKPLTGTWKGWRPGFSSPDC